MDRWQSTARKKLRHGESQKGEDKKWRRSERETVRREKMQCAKKIGKSRNMLFFQCFVAPEGRKVDSLKRPVRSRLARWKMKSCTLLWREAHLEVKSVKTHHSPTTFGSWEVEKVQAPVARGIFGSENVKGTRCSDHFLTIRLPVHVEKVQAAAAGSTFERQMRQQPWVLSLFFDVSASFS